jgi:hypothetical protein
MDNAYISGLFGLLGTGLGALIALTVLNRTIGAEERKHLRELGIKIAILRYEKHCEMMKEIAEKFHTTCEVPPFSTFVVEGMRMIEIVENVQLSSDQVGQQLADLNIFRQNVVSEIYGRAKQEAEQRTPPNSTS